MKNNDLLLYGGIAVLAYLFLKPKTVAPGVTQVAPVSSVIPVTNTGQNVTNQLLTAAAGLVPVVTKYLSNTPAAPAAAPLVALPETASQSIQTPALTTDLPAASAPQLAYQPITTDAYMQEFENGDYPGAEMSGSKLAACMGLY